MAKALRLELIGNCRVVDIATGRALEFRTRKARCLLGVLALAPGASMTREKLASMLWDPAPDNQARASCRQCLKEVKEILDPYGAELVRADRLTVSLDLSRLSVDALDLRTMLPAARNDPAGVLELARRWRGDLFGSTVPNAPVFEAWLRVERSQFQSAVSTVLTQRIEALIAEGRFETSDLADELVRIEPSHELAHQYLMTYHALKGDQAAALRQYAMLSKMLEDELDSEPSQASTDLLVAIKRGDIVRNRMDATPSAAPLLPAAPPRQGPPTIAIRPPLTRDRDRSKDYLAEGFGYLVQSCLARFRCWVVLPWPSRSFDAPERIDYIELGETVGVDYVVDSVVDWRSTPGRLFVALIDCANGNQVWSEVIELTELEIQNVSNNVAGAVSSKLASQINTIALLRIARSPQQDAAAYNVWLRGHQLARLWNAEADREAIALFERAIALDPGLACAHASIASILNTHAIVRPGYPNREADRAKAMAMSRHALTLDPYDSRNHFNMGWCWLLAGSRERAQTHFQLAVDLNPFDAGTLIAAAQGMAFLGQIELATRWSALALELNPLHPDYYFGYLASIRYLAGDSAEAVRLIELCPDIFPDIALWAAAAHLDLDEPAEARAAHARFLAEIRRKWEGPSLPEPRDIEAWLFAAVPLVWSEGRKRLKDALARLDIVAAGDAGDGAIGTAA